MNAPNKPAPEAPAPAPEVIDCEPAGHIDPDCATCRGTGKVGPVRRGETLAMRPCRPCSRARLVIGGKAYPG